MPRETLLLSKQTAFPTSRRSKPTEKLPGCASHLHNDCMAEINNQRIIHRSTTATRKGDPDVQAQEMMHRTCHFKGNRVAKFSQHSRTHKEVLSAPVRPASTQQPPQSSLCFFAIDHSCMHACMLIMLCNQQGSIARCQVSIQGWRSSAQHRKCCHRILCNISSGNVLHWNLAWLSRRE